MSRSNQSVLPIALFTVLLLAAAGCGPKDPAEQIAKIRSEYTVELNAWNAKEPPQAEPAMDEAAEEGAAVAVEAVAAAAEAAEEGAAEEEEMSGPQPKDVLFDLVVLFRGRKALDGITIDVTHADSAQQDKATYQQWIDTKGIVNGETRQVDFMLEGLEVEDGDVFAISLAAGVPADLGEYREFSEPAP